MNGRITKSLQFVLLLASVAGVVISALNVFLFAKLAPITERLTVVERVHASDNAIIASRLDDINKKLDKIENKLDSLFTHK